MKPILFFSALFLISCGAQKNDPHYGTTTIKELIDVKGEPIKEEVIPVDDSKILHYQNDEKYQVQNGVVTNGYMNPTNEERTLIYWKHTFKNCDVKVQKITEKIVRHEKPEFIMKCDAKGTGVVYTEDSDIVLRVIKYETK